jgi:hypothetical protein
MDFKYKSIFASSIKCAVSEEKDFLLSQASIEEVRKFLPNIDIEKNPDLLPVSFNCATVNRINKNGDVINTQTALAIYKNFITKPIDLEHKRDRLIGVILTAGFSAFGSDKILTEDEVRNMNEPFNIILGGVIWRMINPQLSDLIEESNDPTSNDYLSIGSSWELGFVDYDIVELDKGQKNISGGKIISDAKEIEQLSKSLKSNGGSGILKDNKYIYRMPTGNVLPLGIGLTEKPAADVKGVAVALENKKENTEEVISNKNNQSTKFTEKANEKSIEAKLEANKDKIKDIEEKIPTVSDKQTDAEVTGTPDYQFWFCPYCTLNPTPVKSLKIDDFGNVDCPSCKKTSTAKNTKSSSAPDSFIPNSWIDTKALKNVVAEENQKNKNNISQNTISDVKIERKQQFMPINTIEDITDENLKTAFASNISLASEIAKVISDAIKKGNENFLKEKESFANKEQDFSLKMEASNKKIEQLETSVTALAKEKAEREAVEKFNVRMASITEAFDLDTDAQSALAEDVKAIASDEDFSKYEKKAKIFLKGFAKKTKVDKKADDKDPVDMKKDDKSDDKKDDKKSDASVVNEAIDNATKEKVSIANTIDTKQPSLTEKYKPAFVFENFIVKK